jgi:hypothetical protein
MRATVVMVALLGLGACAQEVPDSGVGFEDYNTYLRENSNPAQPLGDPYAANSYGAPTTGTGFSTASVASAIDAADGVAPLPSAVPPGAQPATTTGERARGDAPMGIRVESGEMVAVNAAGISNEQDFAAVASQRDIADDAARIEANRAQYVVIQPGALPVRPGDTGPNIVEFALATTNPVGVPLYNRSSMRMGSADAACAKFASPDQAQQAFLENGGPERDRKGLDPDGDGFACAWDPRPFRTALQ